MTRRGKLRTQVVVFFFPVLFALPVSATPPGARPTKADREVVSVRLRPADSTVILGVPTWLYFVVKNNSDREIEIPDGLWELELFNNSTVKATNKLGQSVPAPKQHSIVSIDGFKTWDRIPPKEEHSYELYAFDFAVIPEPGAYLFTATPPLRFRYYDERWANRANPDLGISIPVKAQARLIIAPKDKRKLGALIEKLGRELVSNPNTASFETLSKLAAIKDERVIPWFVRGMHTDVHDMQDMAMTAFGRFNNGEAVRRLEEGLSCKESDAVHMAGCALLASPHPRALQVLLDHRHDADENTRTAAVSALSRLGRERAIPVLQEMLSDPSNSVREYAEKVQNHLKSEPPDEKALKLRNADEHWAYLQTLEKWIADDPFELGLGLERWRKAVTEFRNRYPEDPRYWRAQLAIIKQMRLGVSLGSTTLCAEASDFAYTDAELKRFIRARQAPKDVLADARAELIDSELFDSQLFESAWLTPGLEQEIADFARDFPQHAKVARFQQTRLERVSQVNPAKALHLTYALLKDPNPAVVRIARVRQNILNLSRQPLELRGTALDGTRVDLSQWRGKVVVIEFCPQGAGFLAKRVAPMFPNWRERGVEVIGIALDPDKGRVQEAIKSEKVPWPVYFDGRGRENEMVTKYDISENATLWLINKKGLVVETNASYGDELEGRLEQLLAE